MKLNNCYHCGEPIVQKVVVKDKEFCCAGCANVFEIIQNAGLNNFYDLSQFPGVSQSSPRYFDYLDSSEVQDKIIQYRDKNRTVVHFILPDVHCVSCVWLLERLHQLHSGIIQSTLNFINKKIIIHFSHDEISLREVAELLQKIGYKPEWSGKEKTKKSYKDLIIKIGVAGFCFGNIMLLSFPEYLSEFDSLEWKKFFSYLSLILSLPIIFYCALPYYTAVYQGFKAKKTSIDLPIVLGIIALLGRSIYDIFYLEQAGYLDTLAGLLFFLLIGKWFQAKVFGELSFERDAKQYLPMAVLKFHENEWVMKSLEQIKTGDVIKIRNEEIVPFDSFLKSDHITINTSFITGEEIPISAIKNDLIYCGSKVTGGSAEFIVKNAEHSSLEELWKNNHGNKNNQEAKVSDKLSTYFTLALLFIATSTFIYWSFLSLDQAFLGATAVLIIACPCALALVTPVVYGLALRKLSSKKIFIKNSAIIQKLQKIDTIVFDKTGTLTSNQFQVNWLGEELSNQHKSTIKTIALKSIHPLSKVLQSLYENTSTTELESYQETTGIGITATVNGQKYFLGTADFVSAVNEGDSSGKTRIYLKVNDQILGHFSIALQVRKSLDLMFQNLNKDYKLYLLSGDQNLNPKDFSSWIPEPNIIKGVDPKQKSDFMERLKNFKGVLMVGDGINDTLAFQKSTVGIAVVEENGSFFPACDGIIKGENLGDLQQLLLFSKACKKTTILCFGFSIIYNLIGLSFAISLHLTPLFAAIFMPISTASIVAISFFSISYYYNKFWGKVAN